MYLQDADESLRPFERIATFRDQTRDYLNGTLDEDTFRALRLRHGLYQLRDSTMLRLSAPEGRFSSRQLRALARIVRDYDLAASAHLTTRQNVQLSGPEIGDVPEILAALAEVGISSFMTSGNLVRSIETDPLAGVAADETEDPRPWRALIDQWRLNHPAAAELPRKFKIAVSGASEDRTTLAAHDLGLDLVRDANGELGFRVLVGGGLGRGPRLAEELTEFVHWSHLLTYCEAILRAYARDGSRSDPYKSRLKNLIQRVGLVEFRALVETQWSSLRDGPATLTQRQVERAARPFVDGGPSEPQEQDAIDPTDVPSGPPAYLHWLRCNVRDHKHPGYAIVTLSTKRPGTPSGNLTPTQLEHIADWAETVSRDEVRLTRTQNLVLPHVRKERLLALWEAARAQDLGQANVGLLTDLVACPGARECDLANGDPVGLAEAIGARFADPEELRDLGPIDLRISGCVNACAHHNLGQIGIRGVLKQGESRYQILIGGRSGREARLAESIGPSFAAEEIPEAIATLLTTYRRHRYSEERFAETLQRLGTEPFRRALGQQNAPEVDHV
ncbi:Ferredoxin--nitrite reductase [Thiorhodococcus drewsii AZ1]|uniref:Ferredoxin--nitrite reductase n=1 Tax=Thiorhodococcus drewsii AZ1 TaxID=765913 RepID=G2DZR1_9GAMM|nr:nitrite/sulfite reductase [Thiorhodococcus drewsii]EGV32288.1 Ferredoxin--nitrite reductase [Thiorhodococcus drewsii AZ1]